MMIGQMEDVYTALHRNGDIEFDYKGISYTIEPEIESDGKSYLEIWTAHWEKENVCIYKAETLCSYSVEKEVVEKVLNAKCFDGKSFVEIQNDVELTWIFGQD